MSAHFSLHMSGRQREKRGQCLELDQTLSEGSRESCAEPVHLPDGRRSAVKADSGGEGLSSQISGGLAQMECGRPSLSPHSVPRPKLSGEAARGMGRSSRLFSKLALRVGMGRARTVSNLPGPTAQPWPPSCVFGLVLLFWASGICLSIEEIGVSSYLQLWLEGL